MPQCLSASFWADPKVMMLDSLIPTRAMQSVEPTHSNTTGLPLSWARVQPDFFFGYWKWSDQ